MVSHRVTAHSAPAPAPRANSHSHFVGEAAIHWPSGLVASVGSDGQLCLSPLEKPSTGGASVRYSWTAVLDPRAACHLVAVSQTTCIGGVTASQTEDHVLVWSLPRGDCLNVVRVGPKPSLFFRSKFTVMRLAVSAGGLVAVSNSNNADDPVLVLIRPSDGGEDGTEETNGEDDAEDVS